MHTVEFSTNDQSTIFRNPNCLENTEYSSPVTWIWQWFPNYCRWVRNSNLMTHPSMQVPTDRISYAQIEIYITSHKRRMYEGNSSTRHTTNIHHTPIHHRAFRNVHDSEPKTFQTPDWQSIGTARACTQINFTVPASNTPRYLPIARYPVQKRCSGRSGALTQKEKRSDPFLRRPCASPPSSPMYIITMSTGYPIARREGHLGARGGAFETELLKERVFRNLFSSARVFHATVLRPKKTARCVNKCDVGIRGTALFLYGLL